MRVEKYQAEDMKEAFRLIKAELGPDAVVVQTRKVRPGGMLGLFRKPVYEVLAAVDEEAKPTKFAAPAPNAAARPVAKAAYAAAAKLPAAPPAAPTRPEAHDGSNGSTPRPKV